MKKLILTALILTACTKPDASAPEETVGGNVVEVTGSDYAFTVPETLEAGTTTFHFANNGKVRHELNISRLKRESHGFSDGDRQSRRSVKDLIAGRRCAL